MCQIAALDGARAALEAEAKAEVERVRRIAATPTGEIVAHVVAGVWATAGVPRRLEAAPDSRTWPIGCR
jgi:hypothetical protein